MSSFASATARAGTPERTPIPVTVIGGYLGAGKTTLVNHLLRQAAGLRLAVLVNDFGELAIDQDLILSQDGNVIGIAGGCVCCSYGSDLVAALMDLAQRTPRIEHVLLETSGVALPGQVAGALTLLPDYTLDAVVTLVDGSNVRQHAQDRYLADTIARQLEDAHLVLLNKLDLMTGEQRSALEDWLTHMAPQARHLTAERAAVPLPVLLGQRLGEEPRHHAGGHRHVHDDSGYLTRAFQPGPVESAQRLADALAGPSLGLLRAKGVVEEAGGGAYVVQIVGRTCELVPAAAHMTRGLVVIGRAGHVDLEAVAGLLARSAAP